MAARRKLPRKMLAGLGLVAGVALVLFEAQTLIRNRERTGQEWFWIVVAVLLILFNTIELLAGGPPDDGPSLLPPPRD